MLRAESDVGVGREVKHDIGAGHRACQRSSIEQIAFDQRERGLRSWRSPGTPRWPVEKLS